MPFPTMLLGEAVPLKHSISVPFSEGVAVAVSVDEKEVAFVPGPNPVPGVAVKTGPHVDTPAPLCARIHELLPPTLQVVCPFLSPVTVHLNVRVSPRQVGGAAVNCAVTSPGEKIHSLTNKVQTTCSLSLSQVKKLCICHIHTL